MPVPRRLGGSVVARFEAARKQQPQDKDAAIPEVAWTWHDEEARPVLLPTSLKNHFSEGALVRVTFCEKKDFPFFVRAHTESYSEKLKPGIISIAKSILNAANLVGDPEKKAKLSKAKEKDAALKEMVMVISDTYMSKRDLWQLQLAMMQQKGRLIYRGFRRNFCEHVPSSSIDRLVFEDGKSAACGMVGVKTDVAFRSSSTHMFLLIEVSAELFTFGLFGRYYWEVLLECFGQCLERACAVPSGKRSTSHFLRIVLFARAHAAESPHKDEEDSIRSPNRKAFTAVGPQRDVKDFYDVIFEGYASNMPPARELRNKVARVFLTLMEEEDRYRQDPLAWATKSSEPRRDDLAACWRGIRFGELVESKQGNMLECLNLALDHFDQHHLDRLLKVSGQVVIILTAGSGYLQCPARELYLLTNRRCVASGHSSFQIVSVRDPPYHRVPWIEWPGGPTISDLSVPMRMSSHGTEVDKLTPFPRWLSFICYQEGIFCPCSKENQDSVKSSFLAFVDRELSHHDLQRTRYIPAFDKRLKENTQEPESLSPKSIPWFQEDTVLRAFRASSNQKTWDEIRLPRLSSAMSESCKKVTEYAPSQYDVNPSRFGQEDGAEVNLLQDLVGLRLAALGGTQIIRDVVSYAVDTYAEQGTAEEEEDKLDPWQVHGNLLPRSLHQLTVQAACGSEWRFEPRGSNLRVSKTEHFQMDRDKATSFLYERFFLYLTSRWGQDSVEAPWIESRTVFHLNERLDWNYLDQVLAGVYRIPPALPYPVDRRNLNVDNITMIKRDSSSLSLSGDTRDGWQLRGALKQHMLILMPKSTLASSHAEIFRCVLTYLEGKIDIGKDPFDAFEQSGSFKANEERLKQALQARQQHAVLNQAAEEQSLPSRQTSRSEVQDGRRYSGTGSTTFAEWSFTVNGFEEAPPAAEEQPTVSRNTTMATAFDLAGPRAQDDLDLDATPEKLLEDLDKMRKQTVVQFERFQEGLRRLLFGRLPPEQFEREQLDIDTDSVHFTVGRGEKQVPVRSAELETSFNQSRDWFGFFYDDVFCPPKFFHLVVEWIACSSIHMTAFLTKLEKLAAEHNFRLLRLPIGTLFPQPAPAWIWSGDQETNFDRLPFYPRRKISFPSKPSPELCAKLLEAWIEPPLSLNFIFSCPIQDFKVHPVVAEEDPKRTCAKSQVYQRLKGWVLCDSDGLALVALREEGVMFFENHIQIFEARTEERVQSNLKKVNQLRSLFFAATDECLQDFPHSQLS